MLDNRDLSGDVGINFNADSGWCFRRCLNLSTYYTTSQFLLMGTSAEAWNSLVLKQSVWATANAVLVMESISWLSRAKHWYPLAGGLQIHLHYLHLPESLQGVVQNQLILHWHGGLDKVFLQWLSSLIFCDFMMTLAFWRKTCYFILLRLSSISQGRGETWGQVWHFSWCVFCQSICWSRRWFSFWKSSTISFMLTSFPLFFTCLPVFFYYSGSSPD